jgi:hypothetical protein
MDTGMGMKEGTIDEYPNRPVTPRTQIVQYITFPPLHAGLEDPRSTGLILEGCPKYRQSNGCLIPILDPLAMGCSNLFITWYI